MFNLILYILITLSLIGLAIILFRKIPLLAQLSEEEMTILKRKKGLFQKIGEIDFKHYWVNLIIGLEKTLRRLKIWFLRTENLLGRWISNLRRMSQIMTQKSKEWIRKKEAKRRASQPPLKKPGKEKSEKGGSEIAIEINKEIEQEPFSGEDEMPVGQEGDDVPISELKKPIKEEQKWIDLIVENPKNITAYKFLGLLYWKQHNYSDAKASLEMAIKLGSKDKKVKEALKELKEMGAK